MEFFPEVKMKNQNQRDLRDARTHTCSAWPVFHEALSRGPAHNASLEKHAEKLRTHESARAQALQVAYKREGNITNYDERWQGGGDWVWQGYIGYINDTNSTTKWADGTPYHNQETRIAKREKLQEECVIARVGVQRNGLHQCRDDSELPTRKVGRKGPKCMCTVTKKSTTSCIRAVSRDNCPHPPKKEPVRAVFFSALIAQLTRWHLLLLLSYSWSSRDGVEIRRCCAHVRRRTS